MNTSLTSYLLIAAVVIVLIALYGNTFLKGVTAAWVTSP